MNAARRLLLIALVLTCGSARALNKQGARSNDDDDDKKPKQNLSGTIFFGAFIFNPTYAARPDNTGNALFRYGLHLDLDLYGRWLTLSYDLNMFTDGSRSSRSKIGPSEQDHIIGLLTTIPLRKHLALTLAVHYEQDSTLLTPNHAFRLAHPNCPPGDDVVTGCYDPHYTQKYVDGYAKLAVDAGKFTGFVALGGFLYNPSYAARPDNAGIALLRYVAHGEYEPLPWLSLRLDFNFFTDRDEFPLTPSEVDITSEVALKWRDFELRFLGESDLPLGKYPVDGHHPSAKPGLKQFYLATILQWTFDVRKLAKK